MMQLIHLVSVLLVSVKCFTAENSNNKEKGCDELFAVLSETIAEMKTEISELKKQSNTNLEKQIQALESKVANAIETIPEEQNKSQSKTDKNAAVNDNSLEERFEVQMANVHDDIASVNDELTNIESHVTNVEEQVTVVLEGQANQDGRLLNIEEEVNNVEDSVANLVISDSEINTAVDEF